MKLQLKKGFLLPEHIKSVLKKKSDYQWYLLAINETHSKKHEELTNLSFTETLARAKEILGKKYDGAKIVEVQIFGDFKNMAVNNLKINKDPTKPCKYYVVIV